MWGSDIANYKKEIHVAKTTGEVMWSCNVTTVEHEGEKCKSQVVGVLKGPLDASAINYVSSLGIYIYASSFGRGWKAIMQTVGTKYPSNVIHRLVLIMWSIWNLVSDGVPVSKWRGWSRRSGTCRGAEVEAERASQS